MSEKSIYMRDTLSLIASDLPTTTLEIMFDEVDALVELAKDREGEAIKVPPSLKIIIFTP